MGRVRCAEEPCVAGLFGGREFDQLDVLLVESVLGTSVEESAGGGP
jgi:hypothetical protein